MTFVPWREQDRTHGKCAGQFHVNLSQVKVILESGTPIEKIPLLDWPIGLQGFAYT